MSSSTIPVRLKNNPYTIYAGEGMIKSIPSLLRTVGTGDFCILVTNRKIYSLYARLIRSVFKNTAHSICMVPDSEKAKSLRWLSYLLKKAVGADSLRRRLYFACLGGGVIGDLTGLAASVYKRGTPFIQIPTTFLAQIDASIGGKTAVDFQNIKNIVGSYYQPRVVIIDPLFLRTLTLKEMKQGAAEAVKYGAISDATLFSYLEKNHTRVFARDMRTLERVTYACARIKARIVTRDEKEQKGIRTILNFGHTVAHALEALESFRGITHGEAVAIGMRCAGYISRAMRLLPRNDEKRLYGIIERYGLLSTHIFNVKQAMKALQKDKKFIHGTTRLVLLERIGKAKVVEDVPLSLIRKSLQRVVS